MTKPAPTAVYEMSEGDWLVRGTDDPMRALELIVAQLDESPDGDARLYGVAPFRPGIDPPDYEIHPEFVAAMADWCYDMLVRARPGYYRRNPRSPYSWESVQDGWTWMLGYTNGPGRGTFRGVYFRGY